MPRKNVARERNLGDGDQQLTTANNASADDRKRVGLCVDCRHSRKVESDRGSTFYRCELSLTDANFPKYPRLPVLRCRGYEQLPDEV